MIAPVHLGYYLIGRDRECQIRPKTRSVSRLHCLVYFGSKPPEPLLNLRADATGEITSGNSQLSFHVLDLNSTSGTQLNGQKIPPRQWHRVDDGTELRCGKIAWQVVVPKRDAMADSSVSGIQPDSTTPSIEPVRSTEPATSNASRSVPTRSVPTRSDPAEAKPRQVEDDMLSGDAWQEADVAAFLAAHDDADRENRYESIRSNAKLHADDDSHVFDDEELLDSEGSFCDELVSSAELSDAPTQIEPPSESADAPTVPGPKLTYQEQSKKDAREKADAARKAKAAKKRKADAKRAARVAGDGTNPLIEKIKIVAVVILTVCVFGLAIYQFVRFRSGPPPRIVEGID